MNKFQVYLTIDVFSRRMNAKASLYRDAKSTVNFLEGISCMFHKIYGDSGSEFDNRDVKAYLKEAVNVKLEKLLVYYPEARGMVQH